MRSRIRITVRNGKPATEPMYEYVMYELDTLKRIYADDDIHFMNIVVEYDKYSNTKVTVNIISDNSNLRNVQIGSDFYELVAQAIDNIKYRYEKEKKKKIDLKRKVSDVEENIEVTELRILSVKNATISRDEAITKLSELKNKLGRDFFVFTDIETRSPAVVRITEDGRYELILMDRESWEDWSL